MAAGWITAEGLLQVRDDPFQGAGIGRQPVALRRRRNVDPADLDLFPGAEAAPANLAHLEVLGDLGHLADFDNAAPGPALFGDNPVQGAEVYAVGTPKYPVKWTPYPIEKLEVP